MTDKLLPCPFCGCEPTILGEEYELYNVVCSNENCFIQPDSNMVSSYETAIKQWNTRAPEKQTARKEDIQAEYDSFWKDIVETDGVLDLEKVKAELHDYSFMLHEVPKVYMHVTGDRMSKPFYFAESVIAEADSHMEDIFARENAE